MEFLLEFLLGIAEMVVRDSKYKSARSRTRAITAFYSAIAAPIVALFLFLTVRMFLKGDAAAGWVFVGLTLLLGVLFAWGILRGHRSNWERKDD